MGFFQVILLLIFGSGFIYLAYQAYLNGDINAGSNWLRGRYVVNRKNDPAKFMLFLLIYLLFGLFCIAYALLIVFGIASPLKLR